MKSTRLMLHTAILVAMYSSASAATISCDHAPGDHVICQLRSTGQSVPSYLPARKVPESGRLQLHSLELESNPLALPSRSKAIFKMDFEESVSQEIRNAANYAAALWSELLTTDEPIHVLLLAEAEEEESSTLASAYPANVLLTAANSHLPEHYSPIVVVNRLYGLDFQSGSPDIIIRINTAQEFYYGTDGQCPHDQHDLVSVILHELGHGLGFYDSVFVDPEKEEPTTARWGFADGKGFAYDYLMVDASGNSIVSNIPTREESEQLLRSATSRTVHFAGPLSKAASDGKGPRLYAPATWDSGSSLAHLEESRLITSWENTLMTPRINMGEVVHDPGPIALAILGDLGWDHIWVNHTQVSDTEDLHATLSFETHIFGDSPLEAAPTLYYREQSETDTPYQQLPMVLGVTPGAFSTPLQLMGNLLTLEYYFGVQASSGRSYTFPTDGATHPLQVKVGPDTTPPTLSHTPPPYHLGHRKVLELQLEARDNTVMGEIQAEFWLDETPLGSVSAEAVDSELWQLSIELPDLSGANRIEYRFTAWDAALARNGTHLPVEGNFILPIEPMRAPATSYANDLEQGAADFILEGFEVRTLPGFTSASLGTLHPYRNNGVRIDSYAYLRQPILVQNGTILSFDEIVLVEPGEPDVPFGESEYWDYVVVEFSTDRGRTWSPMTEGWDSRADAAWLLAYENGIPENSQNSNTVGTPEMYRQRTLSFDDIPDLAAGTEVMLRFYLYSDPYAVGWGWEIDNIRIGVE